MIPLPLVLIFAIGCLVIGAWFAGVVKSRRMRTLETAVGDLEQQVGVVNQQMDQDPQRAGIDMGKRYAANQMQSTIDSLRREVPR